MTSKEKVAYIKGMIEGMNYDVSDNTGKLIKALADTLEIISAEIEDIYLDIDALSDYTDEIDHDLGEMEKTILCDCDEDDDDFDYDDDDDFDYDDEDDDYDDDDEDDDEDEDDDDDDDDDDEEKFMEVVCPECGDTIYCDCSLKGEKIKCPGCDKPVAFKKKQFS